MGELAWSDTLSLGIDSIDAEHQRLLKIANAVIRIARQGMGKTKVINALHYLREYTVYHFRNEEAFMEEIHYPGRAKHAAEHTNLKRKVKAYQDAVYRSEKISADDILAFMREWLIGHVLNKDLDIKKFLEEQAHRQNDSAEDDASDLEMDDDTVPLD